MKIRQGGRTKIFFIAWGLSIGLIILFGLFFLPKQSVVSSADESISFVAAVQRDARDDSDRTKFESFEAALHAWTDGNCLVLLSDCVANETILISANESKTLLLDGHTLSMEEETEGSVLSVDGTLVLQSDSEGGAIKGGNAACGGGILIGARGSVVISGVTITENCADEGGGVYCGGRLQLAGATVIEGNFGRDGEDANIFLTNRNIIRTDSFVGKAGVGVGSKEEKFAESSKDGEFFSDDKDFSVEKRADGYYLVPAALAAVQVMYSSDQKIFPTSSLEILRTGITLTGINVNGAPFSGQIGNYSLSVSSGMLRVGENEITLTTESGIFAAFSIMVQKPSLISIQVSYQKKEAVYADTPLFELYPYFTVKGEYDDGIFRSIFSSREKTSAACGEEYIDDFFTLWGDLSQREGNFAKVSITCSGLIAEEKVEISRHFVDVSMFTPQEVSILEGQTASLGDYAFLPDWIDVLGTEIVPNPRIDGNPFEFSALSPGVYPVEIFFSLQDDRDLELSDGTVMTRLLVYAKEFAGRTGDIYYTVSREGGISPEWDFVLLDETSETKTILEDGLKIERAFTLTFFPGANGATAENFNVRIYLPENIKDEGINFFRVGKDGLLQEVSFKLGNETGGADDEEGNAFFRYLEFGADELLETHFILAAKDETRLYVILAICFGVLCVIGAAILLIYFFRKKKLRFRKREKA